MYLVVVTFQMERRWQNEVHHRTLRNAVRAGMQSQGSLRLQVVQEAVADSSARIVVPDPGGMEAIIFDAERR